MWQEIRALSRSTACWIVSSPIWRILSTSIVIEIKEKYMKTEFYIFFWKLQDNL